MEREQLPNIEQNEITILAERLTGLLSNHPVDGLVFVQAVIAALRKGDLSQARWVAFESGDKLGPDIVDIQQFFIHELFFDTVDERMIPLDE